MNAARSRCSNSEARARGPSQEGASGSQSYACEAAEEDGMRAHVNGRPLTFVLVGRPNESISRRNGDSPCVEKSGFACFLLALPLTTCPLFDIY